MTNRSLETVNGGDNLSINTDIADHDLRPVISILRSANATSSNERNGHTHSASLAYSKASPVSTTLSATMPLDKISLQPPHSGRSRSTSILVIFTASIGIIALAFILQSLMSYRVEVKGCRMSYMRPSYVRFEEFDTEHTRFATKYSLYLYREQGIENENKLRGIPVLFIPGNAGSYKQVRPIAAEAATYFHDTLQHDKRRIDSGVRNLDFFTVDFNEDITAFHGQTLLDQAEYLNEAIRFILSLYSDPSRAERDPQLPDPSSVVILGHSMGGIVARTMLVQSNYQSNSINTIITMSAPHSRPPVTFDGQIVQIYDEINAYWRQAYAQKWANKNPLWHVTLISIAGGTLDTVVPSDYASVEPLVPETHGFTVFTTGIPTVWTSMDHQAILWCDQFRKVVAKSLYDIVDVHRASQTKPRADRMRFFRRRLLSGLEASAEKTLGAAEESILLTLDDETSRLLREGERLVLHQLRTSPQPTVHLLPIPPENTALSRTFSMLTDVSTSDMVGNGPVEVLLCTIASTSPDFVPQHHSNLSPRSKGSPARLACKNAVSDIILIPASTKATRQPFYLENEDPIRPFSYLQYELEDLLDYNFVAVVDRVNTRPSNFLVAEFSEKSNSHRSIPTSLSKLILSGESFFLPAERPMAVDLQLPALTSSLLSFRLKIRQYGCQNQSESFAPLVRQHLERPYESKYSVNASRVQISAHGLAPYVPPPLEATGSGRGLGLQIWSDPSCSSGLEGSIRIDVVGSLGKLYMRYRTVFAAFPLLIVTLVLRKQFRVYDRTGIFISFSDGLDLSLRRSIPLLLLSLTLLAASLEGAASAVPSSLWKGGHLDALHRNELLIGTEDPTFCLLVPLIGIVCIGVCATLHYAVMVLTRVLGILYGFLGAAGISAARVSQPLASQAVRTSTPKRRVISTAVLLFLVSTFIPYQFAYLVACLVQLFTTVRAFHIYATADSTWNTNFYRYAHSILLLMMWVLPINLPILAVWIRNLAVHWLTPFSSHHNVLSIMPFILLVENLTTGRMVPRVTSRLRHVTSVLLFGTAFCAAVYGVSHAYMLHYLVNIIAGWLVILHSTADSWSFARVSAIFDGSNIGNRELGKIS